MSRVLRRFRPGAGFLLIVGAIAACTAFFTFGMSRPPLDAVWAMDVELATCRRGPLGADERRLLQSALLRHPKLASFLVDGKTAGIFSDNDRGRIDCGYAYLIRRAAEEPPIVTVAYMGAEDTNSAKVTVRTKGSVVHGAVAVGAPLVVDLLDDGPFPQLVEIRVEPSEDRERPQVIVRREERR